MVLKLGYKRVTQKVLIFDSGVGGLSVFQEVIEKVANIDCFYLFDNAYYPYGELEDLFLIKRLTELLLSFVKKHPVDLIVIACNSASTVALSSLRTSFSIPVVGVVPAIKPAALQTKNGVIGLLATPATIKRDYTNLLIKEFAADVQVLKIGSTALVQLAEDKLQGIPVDISQLMLIFYPYLSAEIKPDTLVLGCTHFPLLKEEIARCFTKHINLVDSGKAIANRVDLLLGKQSLKKVQLQHKAYYTKKQPEMKINALTHSFARYGFNSLVFYSID